MMLALEAFCIPKHWPPNGTCNSERKCDPAFRAYQREAASEACNQQQQQDALKSMNGGSASSACNSNMDDVTSSTVDTIPSPGSATAAGRSTGEGDGYPIGDDLLKAALPGYDSITPSIGEGKTDMTKVRINEDSFLYIVQSAHPLSSAEIQTYTPSLIVPPTAHTVVPQGPPNYHMPTSTSNPQAAMLMLMHAANSQGHHLNQNHMVNNPMHLQMNQLPLRLPGLPPHPHHHPAQQAQHHPPMVRWQQHIV